MNLQQQIADGKDISKKILSKVCSIECFGDEINKTVASIFDKMQKFYWFPDLLYMPM